MPDTPLARIVPVRGLGMVLIRGDVSALPELGVALPGRTAIAHAPGRSCGWMSPDELLLVLPAEEVPAALDALAGFAGLSADVSDMRCVFDVLGEGAEEVLQKLSPTDFGRLAPDALRRTRLAQVAGAFWRIEGGFRVLAMRSVEDYVRRLLEGAAAPGTWLAPR